MCSSNRKILMKISTAFAVLTGPDDWEPALPPLPTGQRDHLTAGIKQPDESIVVIATLNLEGFTMRPERRSSLLRTFQLMAAGFWEHDIESVVILERMDAPRVINSD
jgi:hypothetical protein